MRHKIWSKKIIHRSFSMKPLQISQQMLSDLDNWHEEDRLELGLATKPGYPKPNFPIKHSAIALYNLDRKSEQPWAIIGRQVTEGSVALSLFTKVKAQKVNEKKFLDPKVQFTVYPTNVSFTKKESMALLDKAEELIAQLKFNWINTNCFSYSATTLILAIKKMLTSPILDSEGITRILKVLEEHALFFGFRKSHFVIDKLLPVCSSIQNHLLTLPHNSEADKKLLEQVSALIMLIEANSYSHNDFSIFP